MIKITLIAVGMAAAQYGAPPPAGSPGIDMGQGFDAAPFAQVYRKCFEAAEDESKAAAADVKQQKYDACRSKHEAIVEHVTAKLKDSEAAPVKRALHRALSSVEKSYAKKMGVVMPEEAKK